jgi:hypothetical protein
LPISLSLQEANDAIDLLKAGLMATGDTMLAREYAELIFNLKSRIATEKALQIAPKAPPTPELPDKEVMPEFEPEDDEIEPGDTVEGWMGNERY